MRRFALYLSLTAVFSDCTLMDRPMRAKPTARSGEVLYWLLDTPRAFSSVHEAYTHFDAAIELPSDAPSERALRSVAITTGWPDSLAVQWLVFAFDPCAGRMCLVTRIDARNGRVTDVSG